MTAKQYLKEADKAIRAANLATENANDALELGNKTLATEWHECSEDFLELAEISLNRARGAMAVQDLINKALDENLSKKNES